MEIRKSNVRIVSASAEEAFELDALFGEQLSSQPGMADGIGSKPSQWMTGSDLPKDGKNENYELLSVYLGNVLVGYAAVYRYYPSRDLVSLRRFYISARCEDEGCTDTVVSELMKYFFEVGYRRMRCKVSLSDPESIPFWFSHGFDKIISVSRERSTAILEGYLRK